MPASARGASRTPPPAIKKHLLTISRCLRVKKPPSGREVARRAGGREPRLCPKPSCLREALSPTACGRSPLPEGAKEFFDNLTPAYHKQVYFCLEFHLFLLCKEGTKPRIIPSRPDTRGVRHRTPRPDGRASTFRRPAAHCTPRPGRSSIPPACGKAARAGTAYS